MQKIFRVCLCGALVNSAPNGSVVNNCLPKFLIPFTALPANGHLVIVVSTSQLLFMGSVVIVSGEFLAGGLALGGFDSQNSHIFTPLLGY